MNALIKAENYLPLIPWKDFDEMFKMFDDISRNNEKNFPPYRISYEDNEIYLAFSLAGYPRENLLVEAVGNRLKITGKKVEGKETGFAQRAFTKDFHDANNVWDFSCAEVKYENGMLTIIAPKREEHKPHQLKIK